jgi:hypothetical protein
MSSSSIRLSKAMSSHTIVDLTHGLPSGILNKLQNSLKNRNILNQTEGCFVDFKRHEFHHTAYGIYHEATLAYNKKDRVGLMRTLSSPLYDLSRHGLKSSNIVLPFQFYKDVEDIKLI